VEDEGRVFPDPARARYYLPIITKFRDTAVGTMTLGVDSPGGLLADLANRKEVDAIRAPHRRLGELVRFALLPGVNSKLVLASLLQCTYQVCTGTLNLTDVVVEVIPRHIPFYCRVFGFVPAAEKRSCERAGGADTVLLWLQRKTLEHRLTSFLKSGALRKLDAMESVS
jgi:hypothetical protein